MKTEMRLTLRIDYLTDLFSLSLGCRVRPCLMFVPVGDLLAQLFFFGSISVFRLINAGQLLRLPPIPSLNGFVCN